MKRVQLYWDEPEEEYLDLRKKKKYRKIYKKGGSRRIENETKNKRKRT